MAGVKSILLQEQESLNRSELLVQEKSSTVEIIIENGVCSLHDDQRSTTRVIIYKTRMNKEDARKLFVEYKKTRDFEIRKLLIKNHFYIPEIISKKYGSINANDGSILLVACLGLISAVDSFNVNRGYDFETFAVPTIICEIRAFNRIASE